MWRVAALLMMVVLVGTLAAADEADTAAGVSVQTGAVKADWLSSGGLGTARMLLERSKHHGRAHKAHKHATRRKSKTASRRCPPPSKGFNFYGGKLQQPLPLPANLRRTEVDPEKGYATIELGSDVYMVTDGVYQAAFAVTGAGVVAFDAPVSISTKFTAAIKKVTAVNVTHVVYSHAGADHVDAAAEVFGDGVEYVAARRVAEAVEAAGSPLRPPVDTVVQDGASVAIGGLEIVFTPLPNANAETTTLLELKGTGVVILIDIVTPGWVPFKYFGPTKDIGKYIAAHEILLAKTDWQHLVAGSVDVPATRDDVRVSLEYVRDVRKFAADALKNVEFGDVVETVPEDLRGNIWLLGFVHQSAWVESCYERLVTEWGGRLAAVDVMGRTHCDAMASYLFTDVGGLSTASAG